MPTYPYSTQKNELVIPPDVSGRLSLMSPALLLLKLNERPLPTGEEEEEGSLDLTETIYAKNADRAPAFSATHLKKAKHHLRFEAIVQGFLIATFPVDIYWFLISFITLPLTINLIATIFVCVSAIYLGIRYTQNEYELLQKEQNDDVHSIKKFFYQQAIFKTLIQKYKEILTIKINNLRLLKGHKDDAAITDEKISPPPTQKPTLSTNRRLQNAFISFSIFTVLFASYFWCLSDWLVTLGLSSFDLQLLLNVSTHWVSIATISFCVIGVAFALAVAYCCIDYYYLENHKLPKQFEISHECEITKAHRAHCEKLLTTIQSLDKQLSQKSDDDENLTAKQLLFNANGALVAGIDDNGALKKFSHGH